MGMGIFRFISLYYIFPGDWCRLSASWVAAYLVLWPCPARYWAAADLTRASSGHSNTPVSPARRRHPAPRAAAALASRASRVSPAQSPRAPHSRATSAFRIHRMQTSRRNIQTIRFSSTFDLAARPGGVGARCCRVHCAAARATRRALPPQNKFRPISKAVLLRCAVRPATADPAPLRRLRLSGRRLPAPLGWTDFTYLPRNSVTLVFYFVFVLRFFLVRLK